MPPDIALLARTLTQLQGLLVETGADVQLRDVLEPYASMIAEKRFAPERLLRHATRKARDWDRLADQFPREAAAILAAVRSGQLEIPLRLQRFEPNINRLVEAGIASSLFLGSTRLWASRVPPTIGDMSLHGAVGTIAATYLAIRVLRASRRAGGIS